MTAIAITGIGVISPIGNDTDTFCRNLQNGTSGIRKFNSFDSTDFEHHHAGEVMGYPEDIYTLNGNPIGKVSQFAIDAAKQAVENAKLNLEKTPTERIAVLVGSTMAGNRIFEILDTSLLRHGELTDFEKQLIPEIAGDRISANVSDALNHKGFTQSLLNACAAGNTAIIHAKILLESGKADYVIAGGADVLTKITLAGFSQTRTVDTVCRPFDLNRKGIVVSEGAGMVVMERVENARRRKAPIFGVVAGSGISSDAHHPMAPHPEGIHTSKIITSALLEAKLSKKDVHYICAHGTGTKANDSAETNAIKSAFAETAYDIPISSIKSMIGHTMGASSAIAVIASLLAMKEGFIPPTINYKTRDPACDLDYTPNHSRRRKIQNCVVNAFGFGGINTTLVLRKKES